MCLFAARGVQIPHIGNTAHVWSIAHILHIIHIVAFRDALRMSLECKAAHLFGFVANAWTPYIYGARPFASMFFRVYLSASGASCSWGSEKLTRHEIDTMTK